MRRVQRAWLRYSAARAGDDDDLVFDSRHEILLSSFERLSQPEFTVLLDCHVSQDEAALNLRIKSINLLSLSRSRSRSEMTSITLLSASNLRVEDAMK